VGIYKWGEHSEKLSAGGSGTWFPAQRHVLGDYLFKGRVEICPPAINPVHGAGAQTPQEAATTEAERQIGTVQTLVALP